MFFNIFSIRLSNKEYHIKQGTNKSVQYKNEKNGHFYLNSHNILDF